MKTLLITYVFLIAQSAAAHGPFLDAMKEMGANFKTIAIGLQSGELTTVELDASEDLQMAIADASLYYPSTADTDPLKIEYSKWMAELNKLGLELEVSIEEAMAMNPQDLSEVTKILGEMNDLRKKGHEKFKDDH